ncbi:hypothetical protein [Nocardioides bruguierae]|uniref:hypothetical protein n=1 Tax=Nocardioides bruguierae TaxID=2945102 RepID=UPI0020214989|nr:hypothetical protein [Nocardioides bruguierae]MCL8026135.1 hypothetical protein [Nocardioides bruguierae]
MSRRDDAARPWWALGRRRRTPTGASEQGRPRGPLPLPSNDHPLDHPSNPSDDGPHEAGSSAPVPLHPRPSEPGPVGFAADFGSGYPTGHETGAHAAPHLVPLEDTDEGTWDDPYQGSHAGPTGPVSTDGAWEPQPDECLRLGRQFARNAFALWPTPSARPGEERLMSTLAAAAVAVTDDDLVHVGVHPRATHLDVTFMLAGGSGDGLAQQLLLSVAAKDAEWAEILAPLLRQTFTQRTLSLVLVYSVLSRLLSDRDARQQEAG